MDINRLKHSEILLGFLLLCGVTALVMVILYPESKCLYAHFPSKSKLNS